MEDYINEFPPYLVPASYVHPIGVGDNWSDYTLSSVLACHGYVIRSVDLHDRGGSIDARAIVVKCRNGEKDGLYDVSFSPVPDARLIDSDEFLSELRRYGDIILRYVRSDDGSVGYPLWHTALSNYVFEGGYNQRTFSLLGK